MRPGSTTVPNRRKLPRGSPFRHLPILVLNERERGPLSIHDVSTHITTSRYRLRSHVGLDAVHVQRCRIDSLGNTDPINGARLTALDHPLQYSFQFSPAAGGGVELQTLNAYPHRQWPISLYSHL